MSIFERFNKKEYSIINLFRIAIILFVIIVFVVIICVPKVIKNVNEVISDNANVEMLNMNDDYAQIITNVAKRDFDWSNLPLSKKFRKKYNQKYGILGKKDNYTDMYGTTIGSDEDKQIVILYVFHNSKEEEYKIHYIVNDNNELDDVEIVDKKLLYDENGNEVIYKETMDGAFVSNVVLLAAPWRLEYDPFDYIYTTDNYLKKWSSGFIPYFNISIENENNAYVSVEPYNELCNKENQEVYFSAEYTYIENDGEPDAKLACDYMKYFKVHYYTDENAWLDDVEVEEISKEKIDRMLNDAKSE